MTDQTSADMGNMLSSQAAFGKDRTLLRKLLQPTAHDPWQHPLFETVASSSPILMGPVLGAAMILSTPTATSNRSNNEIILLRLTVTVPQLLTGPVDNNGAPTADRTG